MPTHQIILTYYAEESGSQTRPIRIIEDGRWGRTGQIQRTSEYVYQVIFVTEDDPEEILTTLRSPSEGGVFVLKMTADGHEIFVHDRYTTLAGLIPIPKKKRRKKN